MTGRTRLTELVTSKSYMKRYAAHFLYESPVLWHRKHVVEVADGKAIRFYPLMEETASTIWLNGILLLSSCPDYVLEPDMDFQTLLDSLCCQSGSAERYVYCLSCMDINHRALLPGSVLERL